MLEKAAVDGVNTVFDRADAMRPCPIGAAGSCCKNCSMGPCRLPAPKKAESEEDRAKRRGVCGATVETIAARN
ncbi:MAG: carbon monoxide dehydrogenase, partial [Candidatus Latescibacteria bacterium]|nr:carbon monoxide dehydrogenase [Candidatus Latescibacterota bacterium]